jgi:glycosyltransferase involved in cell wall biosynthesis
MGGAEKWVLAMGSETYNYEETNALCVSEDIANIYGNLVLGRSFSNRTNQNYPIPITHLTKHHFIPFSKQWKEVKKIIKKSRIIYFRFEVLEVLLLIWFGGINVLKKSVAGIHSPYIYKQPINRLEKFHNAVYATRIVNRILLQMKHVHVLNSNDLEFFRKKFSLESVTLIPNYIVRKREVATDNGDKENLNIVFIGELNKRKGIDILIEIIKQSPENYIYNIVGDGPYTEVIRNFSQRKNVKYHGYLSENAVSQVLSRADILLMPSRAESFPLVSLEAMSHGVPVLNSSLTRLDLPEYVQYTNNSGEIKEYMTQLNRLFVLKEEGRLKE